MIELYVQSTHLKVIYDKATSEEKQLSEEILNTKFSAKDSTLSKTYLVKRGLTSDIRSAYIADHNLLPSGFLTFLEYYYKEANIEYSIYDYRKKINPDKQILMDIINGKTYNNEKPRDYQIEAVSAAIKYSNGIIQAPVGSGKTLIMAMLLDIYHNYNSLLIFNSIDLIEQTYNKLIQYGFNKNDIGIIQGNTFVDNKKITLLSIQSYKNAFTIFPRIQVVISDECHTTGRTLTAEKIFYACQNAAVKIGLSATPWSDNDFETLRLYGNIGPIIYKKEIKEQIEKNYLSDLSIYFIKYKSNPISIVGSWGDIYETHVTTNPKKALEFTNNGFTIEEKNNKYIAKKFIQYGDEYNHFVNNNDRNNVIIYIINKLLKQNKRILVIFNRIEHGKILKELYPNGILISGESSIKEREMAEKQLRQHNGTVVFASNIWATGKDIEEIDVVINATGGHSSVKVIQKLGRAIRKSRTTNKIHAIVIDFDDSVLSPIGVKQTKKRYNVYKNLYLHINTIAIDTINKNF